MKHFTVALVLLWAILGAGSADAAGTPVNSLLYFSQKGCPACIAWDRAVGRLYAKTDEAKLLPLRRVDIDHRPANLAQIQGIHYTPTFVVLHCGHEVARILGYNSDFQFWGLLDQAIHELPSGTSCK